MKPFFLFLTVSMCLMIPVESFSSAVKSVNDECATSLEEKAIPTYTDQELRERLQKLKSAISKPRLTPAVKSYIRTYTIKKRDRTEAMLGRTAIYFPIFEKYLSETQMPDDLKYLSVVESALNPMARSRSGAVGLWQFMKPTGRENGLRVNSSVDERRDPHKSTKAAIKYLRKQYKRYGNWELALAAYNGGPGRVNRAIKRGRSKNFWRIQRYLPRETRNYVPAFIAATYVVNYYHLHDLHPVYPSLDLQLTQKIKVYDRISFFEIANITGTPIETIQKLNPSYKRKYIPANRKGSNLVLPQNYMYSMLDYLGRPDTELNTIASAPIPAPIDKEWESQQIKTMYAVQAHDNLESIAQYYGCTIKDLKHWNQLTSDYVASGQQLAIYVPKPKDSHRYYLIQQLPTLTMDPLINPIKLSSSNNKVKSKKRFSQTAKRTFIPKFDHNRTSKHKKHTFHALKRNETLLDVISLYPGTDLDHIIELNDIKDLNQLKPGTVLLIK